MASKTSWKNRERMYAEWFDTKRNPLSGRNNLNDDGSHRLGDCLYQPCVVEVKLRAKNAVIERARETQKLAGDHNKPFVHIESILGDKGITALVLPTDLAEQAIRLLRVQWDAPHLNLMPVTAGERAAVLRGRKGGPPGAGDGGRAGRLRGALALARERTGQKSPRGS